MSSPAAELQAQVDSLLLEHGAFAPLELLFATGRLLYADYEAWRRREVRVLDEVLMGSRESIREELEQSAAYARNLGLTQEHQELDAAKAPHESGALRISDDARLAALLASRYVPAQSAPQMDLFFDNPVVALTTGIASALAAADAAEATRQLDALYAKEPNHPDLPAFDRLLESLERLRRPVADSRELLAFIIGITSSVRRLLGARARDLLMPLWRHLAEAVRAVPYSRQEPMLHASYAWSQAQAWEEVRASVLAEPEWWRHAPLGLKLVESGLQRRRRSEALSAWFQLCWQSPGEVGGMVQKLAYSDVHSLWQRFLDAEEDALDAEEFPAWLLLHEPTLARQLPADLPLGRSPAEEHYRLVHRWLAARAAGSEAQDLSLRKQLKERQPALFARLLKSLAR
ncbi:MAG TPA: hypothetical protein VHV80_08685 [Steroidobacteraceae bacterium]|nr:hypothetical protein [Steroidobacteraceae bacterium]